MQLIDCIYKSYSMINNKRSAEINILFIFINKLINKAFKSHSSHHSSQICVVPLIDGVLFTHKSDVGYF